MTSTSTGQAAHCTEPSAAPQLSADELRVLRERSDVMGVWLVVHAWALIGASMAMCAVWPHPLTFLAAFVIIGNRQLGLAILMHEASHRLLCDNPSLNDRLGAWLCGAPVGASLRRYRPYHLTHHRHTQHAQDPDLLLSAPFPISVPSMRRKIMRDLLGITGYQRRREQFLEGMGDAPGRLSRLRSLWHAENAFFVSNAGLFLLLILLGVWWVYPLLWVLPLLTWYQLISRLRNICEHAVVGPADDPLRNTRTTYASPLMRLVLAPYWVNYHLEHHLFVFTPCWKLARAHRILRDRGLIGRMEVAHGYAEVLRKASAAADGPGKGGPRRKAAAHI